MVYCAWARTARANPSSGENCNPGVYAGHGIARVANHQREFLDLPLKLDHVDHVFILLLVG